MWLSPICLAGKVESRFYCAYSAWRELFSFAPEKYPARFQSLKKQIERLDQVIALFHQ
jgi:hypothetical protein